MTSGPVLQVQPCVQQPVSRHMSSLSSVANGSSSVTSDTDNDPELDLGNRVKVLEQNNVLAVLFESYLRNR